MENTVRNIYALTCAPNPDPAWNGRLMHWRVEADGFLKQMVRNMAGLLAACGQGKVQPKDIPALLATRDRRDVPSVTAPPQGLALVNVVYPEA